MPTSARTLHHQIWYGPHTAPSKHAPLVRVGPNAPANATRAPPRKHPPPYPNASSAPGVGPNTTCTTGAAAAVSRLSL